MYRGFRAPNLNDLFQPVGISETGETDLLTGGNGDTQLVTKGNAALSPEVAHTYTLGAVLTPEFLPMTLVMRENIPMLLG